ncbi:MAG TPA: energy transducer TonB [Terriglobales bacterium]|nr:energy transducer TonB [Terriglobales bacterium]
MPLRALLFSKDPETNSVLANVCQGAGVRLEVCDDIFTAMDKVKKMPFVAVFVDWSSQPEAGFLVKRARESGPNKDFAAVAIVNRDPSAAEMNENRLQFLLHRPLAAEEARDVLASANHKADPSAALNTEPEEIEEPVAAANDPMSPEPAHEQVAPKDGTFAFEWAEDRPNEGASTEEPKAPPTRNYGAVARKVFAVALSLTAVFILWSGHDLLIGLANSPEGKARVLRESLVAYFHLEPPDVMPVIAAKPDAPPAATASAPPVDNSAAQAPQLQVVEGEPTIEDSHAQLRKAADFPQPTAQYVAPPPPPVAPKKQPIPDSIRGSAPIAPPVVVTVNPSQMMPVSAPSIPAPSSQTFSEPIAVTEDVERSLLVRSVNPDYPAEAVPQKLHGPVVLQATIGRDGSVEDLKIVRGYFLLGKAAIAAVKQWQFKPYTSNGKAARTQTQITVNFDVPKS